MSAIPTQQLDGVAQRGLEVLMDLTGKLNSLADREAVASAAIDALQRATACRRIAIVEPSSENEFAVLASSSDETPSISHSLIEQAARPGLVELRVKKSEANRAQSILDLGIRSSICAPICVQSVPSAFITVDTRDTEGVVPKDAAAFCHSVAQLLGLSFEPLAAATVTERNRELQSDLDAARRLQQLLSPPSQGNSARSHITSSQSWHARATSPQHPLGTPLTASQTGNTSHRGPHRLKRFRSGSFEGPSLWRRACLFTGGESGWAVWRVVWGAERGCRSGG